MVSSIRRTIATTPPILTVLSFGGEELAVAYQNTYGMPIYITHTMNVFGERQHPEKYIPMCIRRVRDGDCVTIHSDNTRTIPGSRHYIHADDVASAVVPPWKGHH